MEDRNPRQKLSTGKISRPESRFCVELILKLADATSVSLSEATIAVYMEFLGEISPDELLAAINKTIREWDRPNMMPPIAVILRTVSASALPPVYQG